MVKVKEKKSTRLFSIILYLSFFLSVLFIFFFFGGLFFFENKYKGKIYPGVRIDGVDFGGKTPQEVENYFEQKSKPFKGLKFTLRFENQIATVAATELDLSYDGKLSAIQSYLIGRSGNLFSDTYQKWKATTIGINLSSLFKVNFDPIDETLSYLAIGIDIPSEDALFQFENGKVTLFKLAKEGRKLDRDKTKETINNFINIFKNQESFAPQTLEIPLAIEIVKPKITTEDSNNFGIRQLLGSGKSKFVGSIPARIHNIVLASSKLNGHLVAPNSIFSFNDTLGDVSASTGFQPAYVIKDGRTVLGDGGGVCQVSTTFFRAILNAGLPVIERHAHSYRVSYYEQDSSPGLDATVFAPNYDLKFKNDTSNYLLIQAKPDPANYTLIFEIYGTNDGRKSEITKPTITSQTPPPPDLFQDDPTLPKGAVKQVDWKAWGAKVAFDYKVTRGDEILIQKTFYSNYQPWQAIFLRGTRE